MRQATLGPGCLILRKPPRRQPALMNGMSTPPFARLRNCIARLGWRGSAWLAVARLLQALPANIASLQCYQFVAQAVAPGSLCHGRGKAITVVPSSDPATLPGRPPRPPEVLRQRQAQGAQCLVAHHASVGTGIVGWLWLLQGGCLEDEVRARYVLASRQSCWDLDVWVHPEQRGALVLARLWEEANARLHAQGVRWSCSRISRFNAESLAAHARIGTVHLGTATFLRCGRWQWMLASLPPYLHLSRHASSVPALHFDTSHLPYYPSLELTCRILKHSTTPSMKP